MRNAVAILGAGTQGRRLAYMWSSRGRPVHLVDQAPAALEGALKDIDNFKNTVGKSDGHQGGSITTFGGENLNEALKSAWLVVEVSLDFGSTQQWTVLLTATRMSLSL